MRAYRGRLEYQAMWQAVRSECMGIPILRGRLLVAIRWKSDESYSMENKQKWKLLNMQNVFDFHADCPALSYSLAWIHAANGAKKCVDFIPGRSQKDNRAWYLSDSVEEVA